MKEGNTEVILIRPMSLIHSQKESDQFPVNLFILSTWHSTTSKTQTNMTRDHIFRKKKRESRKRTKFQVEVSSKGNPTQVHPNHKK